MFPLGAKGVKISLSTYSSKNIGRNGLFVCIRVTSDLEVNPMYFKDYWPMPSYESPWGWGCKILLEHIS